MLCWRPPRWPGGASCSGDRAGRVPGWLARRAWAGGPYPGRVQLHQPASPASARATPSGQCACLMSSPVRVPRHLLARPFVLRLPRCQTSIASWEEKHIMGKLRKIQMAGWARGRRRISAPVSIMAIAVAVVATVAVTGAFTGALSAAAGPAAPAPSRQQIAQHILSTQAARVMTAPAQAALRMVATGSRELAPGLPAGGLPAGGLPAAGPSGPASNAGNLAKPAFTNVRVNDPAQDTHQLDQTTQSETTIAVAGSHVAVGYNDSQQSGLFLTAGSDTTGYSYSADGGASFTDGGTIPDTPEFVNLGDPWLTSTRAGDMYFSTLAADFFNLNLDVAVAKSTDGGKTFGTPVPVFRPPINIFYIGDKPAVATGPDPAALARDDAYVAYDDFSVNLNVRP